MKSDSQSAAGRAFVRSLNILLKLARLYGFEHSRTAEQLGIAWEELSAAIPKGSEVGLLLAATGSQLLLDGVPLEGNLAEKQFAQLLSAAGLASVQFFPSVTQEEVTRFVRAFPAGKAKPAELAAQLKTALAGVQGIRTNEICFVATDSRLREAGMAAQLAAGALDGEPDRFKEWLSDPQKLLELIAAAQGAKDGGSAAAAGSGSGGGAAANISGELRGASGGSTEPAEDEVLAILSALSKLGQMGKAGGSAAPAQQELSRLPQRAQATLRESMARIAAANPLVKPDSSLLLQLSEHLAIRFALERYERGDVKVNGVRRMLERLNQKIENLRKILNMHESKMAGAGLIVETHADILDREFWAAVPESGKKSVLLSTEAWCVPPRNIHSFVTELIAKDGTADVIRILSNYAAAAESEDAEARKKAAVGLVELADLYTLGGDRLLSEALHHLGMRLIVEQDAELQGLVSAAFIRLSQEAARQRAYPTMEIALNLLSGVELQRPGVARSLHSKMGIEERVPEFVEEALLGTPGASGLVGVLRMLPSAAMEHLAVRFNRCSPREQAEQVANLAAAIGEEGAGHLRSAVRRKTAGESVELAGLLCRLDSGAAEEFLLAHVKELSRASQDRAVRLIAASGAPARCRILLRLLDRVDPLVMPLAIDEIGLTGDRDALEPMLAIVLGRLPEGGGPYLQVKAIEAAGRIRARESRKILSEIAESRHLWQWTYPLEMRIAALQALEKVDPAWAREFVPRSGLNPEDLTLAPLDAPALCKFVRQRRHTRVRFPKPILAVSTNLSANCRLEIKAASLTGGVATSDRHLAPGTQVHLKLQVGLRHLVATAMTRDSRVQEMAFEFVDMNLDERSKFRRLLAVSGEMKA